MGENVNIISPISTFGPRKKISLERVSKARENSPKVLSFDRFRKEEPKRQLVPGRPEIVGKFAVPFSETVKPLFESVTGLQLFPSPYGYWRHLDSDDEFKRAREWVSAQGTRIFLRDCLDLSIALDYNIVDPSSGEYTELGLLEHQAKVQNDAESVETLGQYLIATIQDTPFYRSAPLISAVPAAKGKTFDLPTQLAEQVAAALEKENITPRLAFHGDKGSIKDAPLDKKWQQLEAGDLQYSGNGLRNQDVILIDDKYQSGTTMQFVAMKLQQAGANRVFGISLVKTLRNDDNMSTDRRGEIDGDKIEKWHWPA